MSKVTRFVGLDVHARTIAIAVAEGRGQVRSLGEVENRPDAVERVLRKLGKPEDLKVCYEAGPTGYALYWQLTQLGFECEVIAPKRGTSPWCGSLTAATRRSVIWCDCEKRRRKTRSEPSTGWASSCSATGSVRRRIVARGAPRGGNG